MLVMKLSLRSMALLLAGVVLVSVAAFLILDLTLGRTNRGTQEAGRMLEQSLPQFTAILRRGFPQDYSQLVQAVAEANPASAPRDDVALVAIRASQDIATAYQDVSRQAPDAQIADWVGAVAASLEAIVLRGGAQLCSAFVAEGPSALEREGQLVPFLPELDSRDAAMFEAIAEARSAPQSAPVASPTDEDWAAIDAAIRANPGAAQYADILASDDTSNADYCSALTFFFYAIQTMPGDAGRRIRGEYFAQAFG